MLWFCIYFLQCNLADTPTICWRCQWFGWFCGCHYVSTFGYCLRSCCGCLLARIRSLACRGLDFLKVCRRLVIQQSKGTKLEISIWRCALWRFFPIFVLQVIGSFAPLSAFPVEYVGKISACIQVCMSLGRNLAVDIQQCWLVVCSLNSEGSESRQASPFKRKPTTFWRNVEVIPSCISACNGRTVVHG